MKKHLLVLSAIFISLSINAQIHLSGYHQEQINPQLREGRWPAHWISLLDEPANLYGIYHFRKTIELEEQPESYWVHVSADNRYKLFVNGTLVSMGPTRGDIYNWNFETVDLAPFLQQGKNQLAAVVWNYAEQKPVAQMSKNETGFLLQGNTEAEAACNSDAGWKAMRNEAYSPWWEWTVQGYYAVGPGERMDGEHYPWGWQAIDYDDSTWKPVWVGMNGAMKGARDYPGRLLVPTPIPPMELRKERLAALRRVEGLDEQSLQGFPAAQQPIVVPARSTVKLLLDQGQLTTAYLSLLYSGGKGATVTIGYAEALFLDQELQTTKSYSLNAKEHRDEVEGKRFVGYADRVVADGGEGRDFTSLWWRTWRYLNLEIVTADEPLTIDDLYGTFTGYPFERAITFEAPGQEELNRMLDIGWLTARLCANETYMDCPYYEQLQYFGDTRIQAMITLYNTRDPYMVKNAIEQGRQSIVSEGITMSRYPSSVHQFISSFSLWWICMGHDYWMLRGDEEYVKSLLPAYRGVLSWYEQWLKEDYSLGYVPHWFFADWAAGLSYGEPIREKEGNSAFQDLLYLIALETVAEMEEAIGLSAMATHYREIATQIRQTIPPKYWDEQRQLFADTHDHRSYSQHTNALIVMAGIVEGDEAKALMRRTLEGEEMIKTTIYFRYYLHQALSRAGLGDLLLENMAIWRDQMALGLTTWAEMPEPSRSDCHAWGASPNIEFYRILLGIRSTSPGFKTIRIEPALGGLKQVSGSMPHPDGTVAVAYLLDENNRLKATISLPESTSGTFVWKGKEYPLLPGEQQIIE